MMVLMLCSHFRLSAGAPACQSSASIIKKAPEPSAAACKSEGWSMHSTDPSHPKHRLLSYVCLPRWTWRRGAWQHSRRLWPCRTGL